ncbi:hypothetical protein DL93DRAFT_1299455 [Clavulina sp. PMI_390]|nr:hypothetical protein DL93DRAFT_1299455 [Clavulina sp. PMI_390]
MDGAQNLRLDNLNLGAWLVSKLVSTILFGVLTVQCAFYWNRYQRDQWGLKSLVVTAWILDFANELSMSFWTYLAIIRHFGDLTFMMEESEWPITTMCIFVSTLALMAQFFYTRRAYLLNKSLWPLCLLSLSLSVLSFISGIALGIEVVAIPNYRNSRYAWMREVWLISEAATDVLVSCIVVYALTTRRVAASGTVKRGLRRLILYTISDGLLTTVVAVALLILFFLLPNTWTHNGLTFGMGPSNLVTMPIKR